MKDYVNRTQADLEASVRSAIETKSPFAVASLGDAEIMYMLNDGKVQHLDNFISFSGVKSNMDAFRVKMFDALADLDYTLVAPKPPKEVLEAALEENAHHAWFKYFFEYDSILDRVPNAAVCGYPDLLHFVRDGGFFELVDNAVFVSPSADLAAQRMNSEGYSFQSLATPSGPVPSKGRHSGVLSAEIVDDVIGQLDDYSYDVALLGIGAPSMYAAAQLKRRGKVALDVGAIVNACAGFNTGRAELSYLVKWENKHDF